MSSARDKPRSDIAPVIVPNSIVCIRGVMSASRNFSENMQVSRIRENISTRSEIYICDLSTRRSRDDD